MKNRLLILIIFCCLPFSASLAQILYGNEASGKIKGARILRINETRKSVDFVKLAPSARIPDYDQLTWLYRDVLSVDKDHLVVLQKTENDEHGYRHFRYKQHYKSIPVQNGVYYVHARQGMVESANGEFYNVPSMPVTPRLSKEEAFIKALNAVPSSEYRDAAKDMLARGTLVILPHENNFYLAYKFDVYSLEPLKRVYIFIDANTGEKITEYNRIHASDSQGLATTAYNGTRYMTTDSLAPNSFRLQTSMGFSGIRTRNLNNSTNYSSATDFTDTDNIWNTPTIDRYAYDAHFGTEATYNWYLTRFSRNSYDDAGALLDSYVHYANNFVNAFWDGTRMTYGDGDGSSYTPLTSLDIVGHEITHGVTEYTAGLIYANESGALNESYSDCFGVTIDFYANPLTANFLEGDQISVTGTAFRNLANPNQFNHPDTYQGLFWDPGQEVHTNSGVMNYWYYLICQGGSGTNDIGNAFTVNPIGMTDASEIAYRSLSVYLTPSSNYADARFYAIQSATDLFGNCSPQVIEVTNAWYAVGVGGVFSNAVVAGFTAPQNYHCVVPATVNFVNQSINAITYSWDFGDGGTSTATAPSHTYTSAGIYTVTLIANGSAICASADTLVLTNYITVTNGGGPVSINCTPITVSNCCGVGITNVTFNTINNTSPIASEGYRDFTCGNSTTLTAGDPVPISVITGTTSYENVKAWIDYNNDGQFNNVTELVFTSDNKLVNHSGIVNTPVSATIGTPLRLRVSDDRVNNPITSPCNNLTNGQAEDYTVTFVANTLPPVTDFTSNVTVINVGGTVFFTDLTVNAPTSWQWTFPGGTPASSTVQNPSITYNTLGTYPVTLVAGNSFGTDSITKTLYIDVVSSVNACTGVSSTTAPNGQFYDSGGPSGQYQNGENCSLLIDPGCALSVSLSFTQFTTESCCDHLRVYNGTSATAPLLLSASGSSIPATVTANSGKMFITWQSDGSITGSGWSATWSSVLGSANPPVAAFAISDNNPPLSTPVQFTDQTTNTPVSWNWDFGDGQGSTQQNPAHTYTSSGVFNVTLIAANCVSQDTLVQIVTVQGAPIISVNPDTISVTLNCNDSITLPLTIYNTGGGDLIFETLVSGNGIANDTAVLVIADGSSWGFSMSNFLQTEFGITPTVITSSQIAAADFSLYDIIITTGGQSNTYYANINSQQAKFDAFVFAGGILQHQMATMGGPPVNLAGGAQISYGNGQNQNTGLLMAHPILAGITNPLMGNQANHCTFTTIPAGAQILTETVVLPAPTTIEYNYGNGVVIATGMTWEHQYQFGHNAGAMLPNSINYILSLLTGNADWITISSTGDTIVAGDSLTVMVTINSTGLAAGNHTGEIILTSNDPANPNLSVPVFLNVIGTAEIALSDTCSHFGTITQFTFAYDTISITNNGCDTLDITSMISSDPAFSVNPTVMNIPPGGSQNIVITFNPQTVGTFNAGLSIFNNSNDTIICLTGASGSAPAILFNPTSLNVNVNACNDSITVPLWVINTGGSDLDFEFEGSGSSNQVRVLAHLYGVDLGTEYPNTIDAIDQYFTNYTLDTTYTLTASGLQAALVDKDVLLFPEQEFGSITHYASFATVIQNFISGGGQVVICGSSGTTADRIYDMGLFTGTYGSNTSSGNIIVSDTTDNFMDGIPLTFTAVNATFYHNFTNIDKIELASFNTSDIVSYRNIGSGKAVYVGFDYFDSNPQVDRIISNTIRYANQSGLPPWIHVDSTAGTVTPGDSVLVYVTFYSGSLAGGVYTTNLIVTSNDPLIPTDTIQVTLNVGFNPCANFVFDATSPCNGNIQFQDTSFNAPTSWTWYFGDGDSSNVQNPLHVYSAAGNYTVTLIACNASGCDTISYPVTVTAVNGPVAASCTPITTNYCCSAGITRVQLNTINNITPNGTEGYRDFTCTSSTNLTIGISYPITVTTGPTSNENVKAWIDYNNNGVFDPVTELVLTSLNVLNIHTGNVTPPGNAVINTPLRMRVGSDRSINPVPVPCTNVVNGQFEDYTVVILQNTIPPTAAYAINVIDVCTGVVEFTDLSTNFPTSWAWAFGDGQTSALQNPTHQYTTAGTYSVTLIATNAFGSDTLVQFVTVSVINASMAVSGNQMVGQTLQFTPTAPGATSYLWDFGDGFLSSLQSPTHIYTTAGTYIACLTASNGTCSATVCDTLVILPVGLEHIEGISTLSIMPNPFQDDITVSYQLDRTKTITLKVTDVLGQTVKMFLDQQVQKPGAYHFKFNTEAAGTYFIVFDSGGQTKTYKILKSH